MVVVLSPAEMLQLGLESHGFRLGNSARCGRAWSVFGRSTESIPRPAVISSQMFRRRRMIAIVSRKRAALAHDLLLPPRAATDPRGSYPRWDGSKAQRLLKLDIDSGEHKKMKPEKLHATRTEYQDFPLKVFRDHINQETKSRREKAYWLNRPQKGKQKGWGNEE